MRSCEARHKKQDPNSRRARSVRSSERQDRKRLQSIEDAKRAVVRKAELEERAREVLRTEAPDLPIEGDFKTLNEAANGRRLSGAAVAALALLCIGGMETK